MDAYLLAIVQEFPLDILIAIKAVLVPETFVGGLGPETFVGGL